MPFRHPEFLEKRRVRIPRAGPVERVADALWVDGSGGRRSEFSRAGRSCGLEVEVGIGRSAALRVLVGNPERAVDPVLRTATRADSGVIRAGPDREIRSARVGVDSVERPAAEEFSLWAILFPVLKIGNGRVINHRPQTFVVECEQCACFLATAVNGRGLPPARPAVCSASSAPGDRAGCAGRPHIRQSRP